MQYLARYFKTRMCLIGTVSLYSTLFQIQLSYGLLRDVVSVIIFGRFVCLRYLINSF